MPTGIYKREKRGWYKIDPPEERFWKYVIKGGECWGWRGPTSHGYGVFSIHKKKILAHRFSYQVNIGEIPRGFFVLHRCDNPPCVNPEHLWLGTQTDNMRDMSTKGRYDKFHAEKVSGERSGQSKLTWEDVAKIRSLYRTGKYTLESIGKIFFVSKVNVGYIIRNKSWKT